MEKKRKLIRLMYITGIVAFIIGTIDPLEGSVLIVAGSALIALSAWLSEDKYRKVFLISHILIVFGVVFMFYFSSLGGFGGSNSILSWWWGVFILPYPVGWMIMVIVLIMKAVTTIKKGVKIVEF